MTSRELPKYLRIGVITRPHGVLGAFKLLPLTCDNSRFAVLKEAYIEDKCGVMSPVTVASASCGGSLATVKVIGVDSREAAEALRDSYLCVDREHAAKLPEGEYFVADLIGCEVVDSDGASHGILTDVIETGANDVYEIKGDSGELLVPALRKLLLSVDIEGRRIVLDADVLQEVGLFSEN